MSEFSNYHGYKLLIAYDILLERQENYYRYVLGEFIPALRQMGLHLNYAWHIAYGDYPQRLLEFICESREIYEAAFRDPNWSLLEERLKAYTSDYQRKLVRFERRFQL